MLSAVKLFGMDSQPLIAALPLFQISKIEFLNI
jgi:hypothetical protein